MKAGPKALWFVWPAWTLFRRFLGFIGRDNTLHLQETALVIEGDLVRFRLPILDLFVKRAFAEHSLITIPYSRIVRFTRARYIAAKVLYWLLAAAVYALVFRTVWDTLDPEGSAYVLTLTGLLFLLIGYLVHRFFRARHVLVFRRADGTRCVVCFCLTRRKQRLRFVELLKANRDAARRPPTLGEPGKPREAARQG